jgi:C1A family cysteine protease
MLKKPHNGKYPVRADRADWRDLAYRPIRTPLREQVDMRPWASAIEEQGHLGSCTGNAVVGAYELLLNREYPEKYIDLSRLYVYYNARLLEETVDEDSGAYIRDGVKALDKYGVCSEKLWPYDITRFSMTPTITSYQDAKTRNIKNYYRLTGINDILDALNNDYPVVFSMEVYDAFDYLDQDNYVIKMPKSTESPIGGHAMCFVGYDMPRKLLLTRNSFGADWCMQGYCWMPFDYVTNDVIDAWIFDIDLT